MKIHMRFEILWWKCISFLRWKGKFNGFSLSEAMEIPITPTYSHISQTQILLRDITRKNLWNFPINFLNKNFMNLIKNFSLLCPQIIQARIFPIFSIIFILNGEILGKVFLLSLLFWSHWNFLIALWRDFNEKKK